MENSHHQNDIPIWFNGTQRWMTGLTKRTTCDDVIYALLYSTGLHETESTDNYAIFEKWREVERPLSSRTKIVKVWVFWGEEQPNVQLSMRSLDDYFLPGESSLYLRSRRRHKRSSRHKSRHAVQCRCHNKRGCTECSRLRTLEQLVKLVVSQERKIQGLGDRIYDTDKLIDKHEARIHQHRVAQNGMNYVQNSYLNSHSSESSSSLDGSSFSTQDMKDLQVIFPESNFQELEEIACICNDVTHVERRLEEELRKIREMTPEVEKLAEKMGVATEAAGETNQELEDTRVEMIRAVTAHVTNEYNEREIDRKMESCVSSLAHKAEFLREIQDQLFELEKRLGNDNIDESFMEETNVKPTVFTQNHETVLPAHQRTRYPVHDALDSNCKAEAWPNQTLYQSEKNSQNYRPFERGKTTYLSNIYNDQHSSSEQPNQIGKQFSQGEKNVVPISAIDLERALPRITTGDDGLNSENTPNEFISGNERFYFQNNNMKSRSTGSMGKPSRHVPSSNNTPSVHFNSDIQYYPTNCAIQESSSSNGVERISDNFGENRFPGASPRESRPERRGKDTQTSASFQRSRSADRYSGRHRERSLDAFDRGSKHDLGYQRQRHQNGIGNIDRENYGLKVVNQYGLEVAVRVQNPVTDNNSGLMSADLNKHSRPSQGNENDYGPENSQSTSRSNTKSSIYSNGASYNITKQTVQSLEPQQTMSTISQTGPKYDRPKYSETGKPEMNTSFSTKSTNYKQNDENRNTMNDRITYPRESDQELVTLANRSRLRENQRIQNIALNALDNSEPEIRATKGEAFRDRAVFDQGISGPSGMLSHNGVGLQKVRTETSNGTFAESEQTGSEFLSRQNRGQELTTHSSPCQSRVPNANDNNRIPFQTGSKDFSRPQYSVRISNHENKQTDLTGVHGQTKNLPKSRQISDSQIDRETNESKLDAQTDHQTARDKFRNGGFGEWQKYDRYTWSNIPNTDNQTKRPEVVQPAKQSNEISERQQPAKQVQSSIHLSNGSNGTNHGVYLKDDVMNRTWSNSDDVFIGDETKEKIDNYDSSSHPLLNGHSVYQPRSVWPNKNDNGPIGKDQRSLTVPQYSNPTKQYNASTGLGNTVSSQTNSSFHTAKSSPATEKSTRGALYHILSNKLSKQAPDPTEDPIYEVMSRPNNQHYNSQKPFVQERTMDIPSASETFPERPNSYPQEMPTTQRSSDKPQPSPGKPNGLRRGAINPHFYDASNASKNGSYASSKHGGLSNGFIGGNNQNNIREIPVQNTRNQHSKPPLNGFRQTGMAHAAKTNETRTMSNSSSNQAVGSKNTNRVNLRDIISNRDGVKEYSSTLNNGKPPVTMTGNGKNYIGVAKTKIEDNNDSDTGLSSMHSDETANMETLV